MNVVDGTILINQDSSVDIEDLSVTNSAFGLWPVTPSLSKDGKIVSFTAGAQGGVKTSEANLFKIIIRAKNNGVVAFDSKNISIFANDGKGTEVKTESRPFEITVVDRKVGTETIDEWSEIISKDTTPPNLFSIILGNDSDLYQGKKFVFFNATDDQSGVDYYTVSENDLPIVRSGNTYVLQNQDGDTRLSVAAYDRAGNERLVEYSTSEASDSDVSWLKIIFITTTLFIAIIFIKKLKNKFFLLLLFLLIIPNLADAASLSLSKVKSSVSVGEIVSVKVLVNTDGKNINNADAGIEFPSSLLEVVSLSKSSSIFSLWIEEPKFSNATGKISFNGGVPNPGYTGQRGEIISIAFKAKQTGLATIIFADSAIRQNDGLGTNILVSKLPLSFQILPAGIKETIVPKTVSYLAPEKPIVTSITNPDQEVWYASKSSSFTWEVPSDVSSIQTLFNKTANSQPSISYDSSVSQRTINNIGDGISYFHIRYLNVVKPGPIEHYKIQVDTTPPKEFVPLQRSDELYTYIKLNAEDATSGIKSYSLQVDDGEVYTIDRNLLIDGEYRLPPQNHGLHNLKVLAYDKAGNHTEANIEILSPSIATPSLGIEPQKILKNESVVIFGETRYPDTRVDIGVTDGSNVKKVYTTETKSDGSYSFALDNISYTGMFGTEAQLVFGENIRSHPSEKVVFTVEDTAIIRSLLVIKDVLSNLITVVTLLFILIFLVYLGWHKFFGLKRRIKKEIGSSAEDIHKAMKIYSTELSKQLENLKKVQDSKDLNRKEEEVFRELQNNVSAIDSYIDKKLRKIK